MCLTMIDLTTSWFEIVELPTVAQETTVPPTGKGKKVTFDKHWLRVGWRNFFSSCAVVSVFGSGGK
jgi:hypothetical protein